MRNKEEDAKNLGQIQNLAGFLTLAETAEELGIAEGTFRMIRFRMRKRGEPDPAVRMDRIMLINREWLTSVQADRIRVRREFRERQAKTKEKKGGTKKDAPKTSKKSETKKDSSGDDAK